MWLDFLAFVNFVFRDVSISVALFSALWPYRLGGSVSSLLKMEVTLNETVMFNPFRKS